MGKVPTNLKVNKACKINPFSEINQKKDFFLHFCEIRWWEVGECGRLNSYCKVG